MMAEPALQTRELRTLDHETTELGDKGTSNFINAITGKPAALRHLYLNPNSVSEKACANIGKYPAVPNCALESLFLSTIQIGDAGIADLDPSLNLGRTVFSATCHQRRSLDRPLEVRAGQPRHASC
ncbi:hypothetical protein BJ878DRAFT_255959 [Calycina marina]|uniref:Uncharacterized protein n=1 Tax=Calycina marina TaxID=1763456 RepID=A0A9P8CH17_9HELO|nr:hypothetical protein BJ878DRAFT_255959 [Calycina marina]